MNWGSDTVKPMGLLAFIPLFPGRIVQSEISLMGILSGKMKAGLGHLTIGRSSSLDSIHHQRKKIMPKPKARTKTRAKTIVQTTRVEEMVIFLMTGREPGQAVPLVHHRQSVRSVGLNYTHTIRRTYHPIMQLSLFLRLLSMMIGCRIYHFHLLIHFLAFLHTTVRYPKPYPF